MKQKILSICLILISFLFEWIHSVHPVISFLKYGCMALGIVLLAYNLFSFHKYKNKFLRFLGMIILVVYMIILIDTYVIHAISWFPGIVRYPMFSIYIPADLLFFIPGILLTF